MESKLHDPDATGPLTDNDKIVIYEMNKIIMNTSSNLMNANTYEDIERISEQGIKELESLEEKYPEIFK